MTSGVLMYLMCMYTMCAYASLLLSTCARNSLRLQMCEVLAHDITRIYMRGGRVHSSWLCCDLLYVGNTCHGRVLALALMLQEILRTTFPFG